MADIMVEDAFLQATASLLSGTALSPVPLLVGISEPQTPEELPTVVLSLEDCQRFGQGLGKRSVLVTDGALAVQASIDLAHPVLPEDPSFTLLDPSRTVLVLPHSGQVRADGGPGPLGPADLTVSVAGVARTVVTGIPSAADEVSLSPLDGRLRFGAALPASGETRATYFLGQWEQCTERISGVLRVDVCAAAPADVASLGASVLGALMSPAATASLRRLLSLSVRSLSSVGGKETGTDLHRRTIRLAFVYEREINRPESSGGVITRIPIETVLTTGA
jgi:hypothetical protein